MYSKVDIVKMHFTNRTRTSSFISNYEEYQWRGAPVQPEYCYDLCAKNTLSNFNDELCVCAFFPFSSASSLLRAFQRIMYTLVCQFHRNSIRSTSTTIHLNFFRCPTLTCTFCDISKW